MIVIKFVGNKCKVYFVLSDILVEVFWDMGGVSVDGVKVFVG